jgi:hypothetical protein
MKAPKLIGSKTPKQITEDIFHKVKVIDRKREICKVKCDIDNGLYNADEQIYVPSFQGTHRNKSFRSNIINLIRQLLP